MLQNTTDLPELESQLNLTGEGVTLDELLNITTLDSVTTSVPDHACDNREYEIVSGIAAAVCITFGILYTFFGYRFFKAILFLTGFLFCAVTVYMILSEVNVLPLEGVLGCAAGAGVLVGLVAMLIQYIGLFLTGFCLGLSAAAIILVVVEQFTHPYNMWIPIVVYLILGIATGLLGLRFQKAVIILSTSVIGGALALAGIDYFVGLLSMTFYLWDRVIARPSEQVCWFSWLILGLWPVVALAGAIVQWKFTGHEIDHRIVLRREQSSNVQTSRAREKRETQQTRYRHLYQARRVKGDVISQTFLQSIESKLSPAMQSLTALNTEPSNEEESTATTTLTHLT